MSKSQFERMAAVCEELRVIARRHPRLPFPSSGIDAVEITIVPQGGK